MGVQVWALHRQNQGKRHHFSIIRKKQGLNAHQAAVVRLDKVCNPSSPKHDGVYIHTFCGWSACGCGLLSAASSSMSFSLFASGSALVGTGALSWEGFLCLQSLLLCSPSTEFNCCSVTATPAVPGNTRQAQWRRGREAATANDLCTPTITLTYSFTHTSFKSFMHSNRGQP